jgi:hypothetical protein
LQRAEVLRLQRLARGGDFLGVTSIRQARGILLVPCRGLIIPSFDMPGRICGILSVVREGLDPKHVRYNRAIPVLTDGSNVNQALASRSDSGLCMYRAAWGRPHPEFGDTLVAIAGVVAGMRLQLTHLVDHLSPLPLVSYHADARRRPHNVWNPLRGRPIVIWPRVPDMASFLAGYRTGGRIVPAQPEHVTRKILAGPPEDAVRWAINQARPWREILARFLEEAPAQEAAATLGQIDLPETVLLNIREIAGPLGRARVEDRLVYRAPYVSVPVGDWKVRQDADGWHRYGKVRHRHSRISGWTMRIERIVRLETSRRVLYVGVILRRGVPIPFSATDADIAEAGDWFEFIEKSRGKTLSCQFNFYVFSIRIIISPSDKIHYFKVADIRDIP